MITIFLFYSILKNKFTWVIKTNQAELNAQERSEYENENGSLNQFQENRKSLSLQTILKNRQFDIGPILQDIDQPKFQIDGMKQIQKSCLPSTDDSLDKLDDQIQVKSILKKTCKDLQYKNDNQDTYPSERSIKQVSFNLCERQFYRMNKIKGQKCQKKKSKKQSVTMQQLEDEFQ
ncbi:hypothetical protein pb186bvf_012302 [Paramecium bursaria]